MTFEEYLVKKNIDSEAFKQGDPSRWEEFKALFDQVHPNSFTLQKLFLINKIRRVYQLKAQVSTSDIPKALPNTGSAISRPTFKVSPKVNPDQPQG